LDQKAYLDDDGGQSTEVTGFQLVYAFSGDRIPGNAAQDFIFSKALDLGIARHTNFRATGADGTVILGECTIANIQLPGGEANSPAACGFEIHLNGKPSKTDPMYPPALAVVVSMGSGLNTTKFTATPGASNKLAYRLTVAPLNLRGREYIPRYTDYSSGSDITAAVNQYLTMYELDQYNHVVRAAYQLLQAADIKLS
jgi:hypothetical protein